MSQAAKAQEPSMEEILASIRRIIADDDGAAPAAKADVKPEVKAPEPAPAPPPAPKVAPPVAKAPPPTAKAPAAPPKPAPPPPAPPAAAIKQDDIDAMLAGLDEPEPPKVAPKPEPPKVAPKPEPAEPDVLELTEAMQAPAAPSPPAPAFRTIDGRQDVVFDDVPEPEPEPPRALERPRPAPSPAPMPAMLNEQIISSATAAAVDSAFHALAQTVLVQNATTLEDLVKEMLRPMLQHWLDNNLPTLVERLVRAEIERVARGR
jgi:cell pole-organizing protein PopZ